MIEDDAALGGGLRSGLASVGFAVDVAGTVAAAGTLLRLNRYEIVLLDLGMPDGDGIEFLRSLRESGNSTPVIVLTARRTVTERVDGLNAGADDYLAKPFALPELIARIRALLRRPSASIDLKHVFGNVEYDPAAFVARCGGALLDLTVKEMALLEYLLTHRNTLVTRTMLLDHCWDDAYDGLSNLVDVHISHLRRKLEKAGARCRIRTVRGAGFVFEESE